MQKPIQPPKPVKPMVNLGGALPKTLFTAKEWDNLEHLRARLVDEEKQRISFCGAVARAAQKAYFTNGCTTTQPPTREEFAARKAAVINRITKVNGEVDKALRPAVLKISAAIKTYLSDRLEVEQTEAASLGIEHVKSPVVTALEHADKMLVATLSKNAGLRGDPIAFLATFGITRR